MRQPWEVVMSLSILGIVLGFGGFATYKLVRAAIDNLKSTRI